MSDEQLDRLSRVIAELEARLARVDREASGIREDLSLLRASVERSASTDAATSRANLAYVDAPFAPAVTAASATIPSATIPSATIPSATIPSATIPSATPPSLTSTSAAATSPTAARETTPPSATIPNLTSTSATSATATAAHVTEPACAPSPSRTPVVDATAAGGFEQQVALVWFARVGALVLLCGVGYLYSYAVDRNWISPLARCLLGATIGFALIGGAELLRRTTHALYVQVLLGLGVSFLYLSDYAAYSFYALLTAPMSLRLAAVISFGGGLLATRHRSQAIFIFSLLGGFLAPILLSTGQDQPVALFAYLLAIGATSLVVSLRKRFLYAAWVAIAGTQLLFFGWYFHFFNATGFASVSAAYATLSARSSALTAVVVFTLEALVVHRRSRAAFAPPTPLAFLIVALLFGHAGAVALLFDLPLVAIPALFFLAVVASLFLRDEAPELLAVPLIAGWFGLLSLPASVGLSLPLIGMLAWAAAYFAASVEKLVADEGPLAASRLLPVSLAGIAAVQLAILHTGDDDLGLRAVVIAAVGIADGVLAFVLRHRRAGRSVNLLVGQSFALIAIAVPFAFVPLVVTSAWSLLAAGFIGLAAREKEADWLGFALVLWMVAIARALGRAFGSDGIIEAELVACAVGLFASWAVVRRHDASLFRFWSPWLVTAGHFLLLSALLMRLATWLPELPDTLVLAIYATLLVAGGFVFRERQHRYLGLTLFAVTIAKLLLWDVFHRDVLFRVLVLIGVGVLLLGASFLYARYGRRLLTLVRDGDLRAAK